MSRVQSAMRELTPSAEGDGIRAGRRASPACPSPCTTAATPPRRPQRSHTSGHRPDTDSTLEALGRAIGYPAFPVWLAKTSINTCPNEAMVASSCDRLIAPRRFFGDVPGHTGPQTSRAVPKPDRGRRTASWCIHAARNRTGSGLKGFRYSAPKKCSSPKPESRTRSGLMALSTSNPRPSLSRTPVCDCRSPHHTRPRGGGHPRLVAL